MNKEFSAQQAVRHFGIFRSLRAAIIQFQLVAFRLVVGVLAYLSGVPANIVAIVSMLEFTLNSILEVPFGYFADRFGRVACSIIALTMIMIGIICAYIALLLNNETSKILYIAYGIILGIAKPLYSGAPEAFYQNAIHKLCKNLEEEKLLLTSFTDSQKHGKYFSCIAVFSSFILSWFLYSHQLLPHIFLVTIFMYAVSIVILFFDYLKFKDLDKTASHSSIKNLLSIILKDKKARESIVYSTFFWLLGNIIAGFLIISIGRENSGYIRWVMMISFMSGYGAVGYILKGYILPDLIHRLSQKVYLLLSSSIIFISSSCFWLFYKNSNFITQSVYLFCFGIISTIAMIAIQSLASNQLIAKIPKQDHTTALSIQNVPGYFLVGIYSYYLVSNNGAASMESSFLTVAVISALLIFFVLWVEPEIKSKT